MAKLFAKTKENIKSIHWPSFKEVASDTTLSVVATVILSSLILVWTSAIEFVINWIVSLLT